MKGRVIWMFVALLALGMGTAPQAAALGFTFTQDNAGLQNASPSDGNYGTLTVTLDDGADNMLGTADDVLTFSGMAAAGYGFTHDFGFNLSDENDTMLAISGSVGYGPTYTTDMNVDGFGSFDIVVAPVTNGSPGVTSFSFDVTRPAGFTDLSIVTSQATSGGEGTTLFAIGVSVNTSCQVTGACTGFAGTGTDVVINPTGVVPEPATLSLVGSALVSFGVYARRWRTRRTEGTS